MEEKRVFNPITIRILRAVAQLPGISRTELRQKAGMSSSVNETINDLIQFGFINEKNYLLFNKKSYELTQKGHNLLEAMELVYDIAYGGAIAEEGRNGENPAQTARIKE